MVKAVLRGKFIAIQACLMKQEKPKINSQILHLKKIKKKTTNKSQSEQKEGKNKDQSRNKWKSQKIQKINETNNWSFEKIPKLINL